MELNRKLKMGMIGGGPGAFIGEVHRKAARMDGHIELVAGAFDINPRKSKQQGRELMLDPKRVYGTYQQMIERELKLPEGERIDFVAITMPNNWHFPIARDFLNAGFHVMCEKPMTINSKEAKELKQIVQKTRKVFGLMHNYTDYPMAKLTLNLRYQIMSGETTKILEQRPQAYVSILFNQKSGEPTTIGIVSAGIYERSKEVSVSSSPDSDINRSISYELTIGESKVNSGTHTSKKEPQPKFCNNSPEKKKQPSRRKPRKRWLGKVLDEIKGGFEISRTTRKTWKFKRLNK